MLTLFNSRSLSCKKTVKQIPEGRLFAYIRHRKEHGDEGDNQGYIVYLDFVTRIIGSPTVMDGKGYIIFASGAYYHGYFLKDGHG